MIFIWALNILLFCSSPGGFILFTKTGQGGESCKLSLQIPAGSKPGGYHAQDQPLTTTITIVFMESPPYLSGLASAKNILHC